MLRVERLKETGVSVTAISKMIGCNRSKLSSWLNGNCDEFYQEYIDKFDKILPILEDGMNRINEL